MPLTTKCQELVDLITRNREKLFAEVSGLSDAQLNHKSEGSPWSICDAINHVALTDEANAKLTSNILKRARSENISTDPSPDRSELHSIDPILEKMRAGKFQAPDFVNPHAHASVDESFAKLKHSRERMLENIGHLDGLDLYGLTHPHPFAGPLNPYQWILIAGAHESRHTAQIERMKSAPDFPK